MTHAAQEEHRGPGAAQVEPQRHYEHQAPQRLAEQQLVAVVEADHGGQVFNHKRATIVFCEVGKICNTSHTGLSKRNGPKLREIFCPAAASHSRPRQAGA